MCERLSATTRLFVIVHDSSANQLSAFELYLKSEETPTMIVLF